MRWRWLLLAALPVALAASCSAPVPTDAAQAVYALDSAYIVAATAEAGYIASASATPSAIAQVRAADNQAFAALQPLSAAARSGGGIDTVALAAAQATVAAFGQAVAALPKPAAPPETVAK